MSTKRAAGYNTKQREAILAYMASLQDAHVTAAQITAHFARHALPVGRTTVYRHLDKLTKSGAIRRFATGSAAGACYQYVRGVDACHAHLHLQCEQCGRMQHLECGVFGDVRQHVYSEHAFEVNALKTVLYGTCSQCLQET